MAADTALALVRTAPQLLADKRYLWTIESRSPKSNGRPVLLWYFGSALGAIVPFDTAIFRSASILVRNVQTVLSLGVGKRFLNFLTAAAGPFIEAYFPISYRSSSLHFICFDLLGVDAPSSNPAWMVWKSISPRLLSFLVTVGAFSERK